MADEEQPAAPAPAAGAYDPATLNTIIQQLMQQPAPPQPVAQPSSTEGRGALSLLGEALGGGEQYGTTQQREAAGLRALQSMGMNMMANSGYAPVRTPFGQILASGMQGAQQSLGESQQVEAAQMAAQQQYAEKQQEMQLERLKTVLPLLRMQQGAGIPNLLAGGGGAPSAPNVAQGGSIATVARDQSVPTAGQQGNNSGNLMADSSLPPGAIGRIPVAGGRFVAAFPDVPTGVAAQSDNLAAYKAQGINTIRAAVNRWVGDPKANTDSYAADVAKAAGVGPDDPVDLTNPAIQKAFLLAQQPHESGKSWLAPADVDKGLALAAARRAAPPGATTATTTAPAPYKVAGPTVAPPSGTTAPATATPAADDTFFPNAPSAAAPAPQQTSQADQPPAPPPVTTPPAPAGPMTIEQYRALHPSNIDPSTFTVTPDSKALAQAEAERQTAAQNLQQARLAGDNAAANKALNAATEASSKIATLQQQAQVDTAKMRLEAQNKAEALTQQGYNDEMTRQQQAQLKAQELAQTAAQAELERQNKIDLAKLGAGQTWHQKLQEQSAQNAQEDTLKPMAEQAAKAHNMNLSLAQLQPLLQDLPPGGGALGTVLNDHPDLAPLFNQAGILNDKSADAVRLVNGLVANISTQMKPTGLGALREYEWDAFKSQLPSMLSTPAGQQKAIALLMNMNNRIGSEASWMNNYFSRKVPDDMSDKPGAMMPAHNLESDNPTESVQQRMDRELGPIVPSAPPGSNQSQWEQSLPPGKPYYKSWALPDPTNPKLPKRDAQGNVQTKTTLEVRPWQ